MRYVRIGNQQVSVVGLGTWQFGSNSWGWGTEYGPGDVQKIVHRAMDLGINLIDTAEMYGRGQSEELIGKFIHERRSDVFLATKVSPHHVLHSAVLNAAHRSLKRLNTDYIDLYQVHFPNPLVPDSWTMKAMAKLQADGFVGHVGVSNYGLRRWQHAEESLGVPIFTNQLRYHLLDRSVESEVLPYAITHNRFVIAYSPLAQGLLSGRYSPKEPPRGIRLANPLFTSSNLRRAQHVMDTLEQIGDHHGATSAQIALAWLLHNQNVVVIPGAKTIAQVEANAFAADIELDDEEVGALASAAQIFGNPSMLANLPQMLRRLIS